MSAADRIEELQEALGDAQDRGDTAGQIDTLHEIGRAADERSLAMTSFNLAETMIRREGLRLERLASLLGDRALAHRRWKAPDEALRDYQAAEAVAREHGTALDAATYLGKQGGILRMLQRTDEARDAYLRARQELTALGDEGRVGAAEQEGNLGLLLAGEGRHLAAEAAYRRTVEQLPDGHPASITWLNNLGNVLARRRRYGDAERFHDRALALAATVSGDEVFRVAIDWAQACRAAHRSDRRIEVLLRAAELVERPQHRAKLLDDSTYDLKLRCRWRELGEVAGRFADALRELNADAVHVKRAVTNQEMARKRLEQPEAPGPAAPRPEGAPSPFMQYLVSWMVHAEKIEDAELMRDAGHLMCDLAFAFRTTDASAWAGLFTDTSLPLRVVTDAIAALIKEEQFAASFDLSQRWKGAGFAFLNLARVEHATATPEVTAYLAALAELTAAVRTMAADGGAQIQRLVDDVRRAGERVMECGEAVRDADRVLHARLGGTVLLEDLRETLPRNSPIAIVDLVTTVRAMTGHVITLQDDRVDVRGMLSPYLGMNEIVPLFEAWREGHVMSEVSARQREALVTISKELHDRFFCGLSRLLAQLGATQLILVPDVFTRHLPLHLAGLCGENVAEIAAATRMKDPPKSESLMLLSEVFPVEYAPCLQVIVIGQAQKRPRRLSPVLSLADPEGNLPSARFAALHLEERLQGDIGIRSLTGEAATWAAFRAHLPASSLIVLGCHGRGAHGDTQTPQVALADRAWTSADIIDGQALAASPVVVLSACEVGAMSATPDDAAAIGLPGALLSAGAACVVAPMWPVEDLSIGFLVERLFSHLTHQGYRPSAALFRAIYDLRQLDRAAAIERGLAVLQHMQDEGLDETQPASYQALGTMLSRIKNSEVELPFDNPQLWGSVVVHGCGWGGSAGGLGTGADPTTILDDIVTFSRIEELISEGELAEARAVATELLPRTEGVLRARTLSALAHVSAGGEAVRLLDEALQLARHEQDDDLVEKLEHARAGITRSR